MSLSFESSSKLPKQFVISKSIPGDFANWRAFACNGWTLACSDEVPVITVNSPEGTQIGLLIGWVIRNGIFLENASTIEIEDTKAHSFLDILCGRYIYLFSDGTGTHLRTDAGGLLPVVYNPESNCAGSSPTALVPWKNFEINEAVQNAFDIPNKHGWYPFGLTPYKGMKRLLPNHQLCLETWRHHRFWPLNPAGSFELQRSDNPRQTTTEIADLIQGNVGAIIKAGRGISHLTAGYDSRMVIAATKPYRDSCIFETVDVPGEGAALDCHVAEVITKKLHLTYETLGYVETTGEEKDAWLNRTGYCVNDHVTDLAATAKFHDRHYHALTGTCGEVARAYYWADGRHKNPTVSPEELVRRIGAPKTAETLEAAREWMDHLPVKGGSLFWDLVYIEQRLGCWAGPSVFGHDVCYPSLSPFNSPIIYKLMLSLPDDYRSSHQFVHDYVEYLWPELLAFPYNQAIGLTRLKFAKAEIKAVLPENVKGMLKSALKKIKA
jgi:predicted heme/steroid binding protein